MRKLFASVFFAASLLASPLVLADEVQTFTITLKDHKFDPATLKVPANQPFKLIVQNLDPTPEEFESKDLNREKIVAGGGKITMPFKPLKPGTYGYYGEFNASTAQGTIVAE